MKKTSVLLGVLLAATGFGLSEAPSGERLAYRFEEVKSKVVRSPGGDEARDVRVAAGDPAEAGDVVTTGFFGRTVVAVPERAARFEVFSSSKVQLAGGEPGILLVLEKGRIKATFDAFTGASEARRVAVPGAILAVRGTRYGVEVAGGESVLAVFEGTVELFPAGGAPSMKVGRDEFCVFGPKTPPRRAPMGRDGMNEKSWGSLGSGMTEGRPGAPGAPGAPGMPGTSPQNPGMSPQAPGSSGSPGGTGMPARPPATGGGRGGS
ncbi:MAG: FecR domain-containing protein [Holophagales bacterium]|jgi:hypothetical protein|nr:FecR domain-containing protein [Holophagales bacterium]